MTAYDIYIFLLCLIVFIILTALLTTLIVMITKLTLRVIKHGGDDKDILAEYYKSIKKKKKKAQRCGVFCKIFSTIVFCALFAVFGLSVYMSVAEKSGKSVGTVARVVQSGSMQEKHKKNKYLFENNLNNQIATFDLILTHKLPAEKDLKLYDIVVYEADGGILVVHRIVGIEEPNDKHSERYFLLQGDAVSSHDIYPVLYEQMRGIYRNERVPFVGSFVNFLQSPAGYLCILLVIFSAICSPIMDKKIEKARAERLAILLAMLKNKQANEKILKAQKLAQKRARMGAGCPYANGMMMPPPMPMPPQAVVNGKLIGYVQLLPVPNGQPIVDLAELDKQYQLPRK